MSEHTTKKVAVVVLAAGKGTRLKMDIPKPLAPLHQNTLVDYVIETFKDFGDITLVTGHQRELVEEHVNERFTGINYVYQKEQLGTGHAVQTYLNDFKNSRGYDYTIVTCADTPLITKETISALIEEIEKGPNAVCATFTASNPTGYGRIIRKGTGFQIVEEKDATDEQRLVTEVNSGLYIFKTLYLMDHVFNLSDNNKSGEFYLTDTFNPEANVTPLLFEDAREFLGVNNLIQLSNADIYLRRSIARYLMLEAGVRFSNPSHTYCYSKNIGQGTHLFQNAFIDDKTVIGKNVVIEQGVTIKNSIIEDGAIIKANSYITDSKVSKGASIGPMAQLRPGSDIGEGAKIGNFVEIKKSKIGKKSAVSHLSYAGDAEIGDNVNIGCGFITCNYDGANKHKTIIGDGSFIGSDSQMIAPIEIGKECYVASGSTISKSMPDGSFAIARGRQETKEGMAKRFIRKKSDK